jgi:hypothetical protein
MVQKRITHPLLLFVGAIALTLALIALIAHLMNPTDISHEQFEQIDMGMTETDVLRLLRIPPADYRTYDVNYEPIVCAGRLPRGISKNWLLDSKHIIVWFHEGRVDSKVECRSFGDPLWLRRLKETVD